MVGWAIYSKARQRNSAYRMYVTVGTGNSHDRMIPTDIEKSDDILRRDNLISDAHVVCPRSKSLGEATNKAFSRFDVYAQKFNISMVDPRPQICSLRWG